MLVGTHVPAGNPLVDAARCGADVVQLHLSAPRQWRAPLLRADAAELAAAGIVGCVHAPYLCNPASADPAVRAKTTTVLQQTLDEAARVGAGGVVVHAGHAAGGGTMADALDRWLETARPLRSSVPLLIENTATGTVAPGRHLADLVRLFEVLRGADLDVPVGACLDTCHAFAGDAESAADPVGWVKTFAEAAGGIAVLHVNDSKAPAGGGRDLHTNVGAGEIPAEVMEAMVVTAAGCGAACAILETPGGLDTKATDMDAVRAMLA